LLAQRTRNCSILVVNLHQEITEDKKDFPWLLCTKFLLLNIKFSWKMSSQTQKFYICKCRAYSSLNRQFETNENIVFSPLKTMMNLKYISWTRSYRAVNTLRPGYKRQSVNAV
jgi:hypothetical protein